MTWPLHEHTDDLKSSNASISGGPVVELVVKSAEEECLILKKQVGGRKKQTNVDGGEEKGPPVDHQTYKRN